ncbi:MAG TPA: ChaN family lipoprotein, partial [Terriglobia bacterium]|nr:ChaN family lipoprotein [Terriglobia bacterium]
MSLCLTTSASPRPDLTIIGTSHNQQLLTSVVHQLATKRVVFIGENHDRYDNHLDQLEIIRKLHAQAPDRWVIGIEYIQRPFQPFLDEYIDKTIDEADFLRKTEYFDRWGYDYRLYRPIFRFAR